ncbi:MAG: hypothetical protein AB7O65_00665 [Candidatus Korobacteraceae bacterium]
MDVAFRGALSKPNQYGCVMCSQAQIRDGGSCAQPPVDPYVARRELGFDVFLILYID